VLRERRGGPFHGGGGHPERRHEAFLPGQPGSDYLRREAVHADGLAIKAET
jgi:hypothetical protein